MYSMFAYEKMKIVYFSSMQENSLHFVYLSAPPHGIKWSLPYLNKMPTTLDIYFRYLRHNKYVI